MTMISWQRKLAGAAAGTALWLAATPVFGQTLLRVAEARVRATALMLLVAVAVLPALLRAWLCSGSRS